MFEGFLADALNRALGEYCVGIDSEKIRVSAWQGDVELRNVQLKKTALDALRAPIALDAGYIGSLRLKVPWTNLGEDAVVVEIDRVFLLASRVTLAEAERNAADLVVAVALHDEKGGCAQLFVILRQRRWRWLRALHAPVVQRDFHRRWCLRC